MLKNIREKNKMIFVNKNKPLELKNNRSKTKVKKLDMRSTAKGIGDLKDENSKKHLPVH